MFDGKSDRPYLPVEEVAAMLRVSAWTLYRNLHDVPHVRVGRSIMIRCEWLFLEPPEVVSYQPYAAMPHQMVLPFEVKTVRTWRNTGQPIVLNPYGEPLGEVRMVHRHSS